jgi:hypothetical protein
MCWVCRILFWSSDKGGRTYTLICTHARPHTSNHAWMSGEASKNIFNSNQDQSRLLFNDDVSLKNIVGDRWMNDYEVFEVWYWQEETEIIVGKPVSGPHCLSQISYWPTWIWTSAYAVRGRLVIAIPWPGSIQKWLGIERKKMTFLHLFDKCYPETIVL